MLAALIRRSADPLVRIERIKLMAGGTQLVAIGILVGSVISPFFNSGLLVPIWTRAAAAVAAAILEVLALRILSYLGEAPATGG